LKKDIISKDIIKKLLVEISKYFLNLDISNKSITFLDKELNRIEKREADIVANINDEYILHLEIQNNLDSLMPYRMLRYYTDIAFTLKQNKKDLPIKQYLIYIGKEKANFNLVLNQDSLQYKYNFVDLKQIDCNLLLNENKPEALILAILCDFKDKKPKDIVSFIIDRLREYSNNNSVKFRNYMLILETLSSNRNLKDVVKEIEMLRTTTYQDLPSWEIGYEMGLKKSKIEDAFIMVKDFNLDPKEVAKKLNISLELLLEKMKKENCG